MNGLRQVMRWVGVAAIYLTLAAEVAAANVTVTVTQGGTGLGAVPLYVFSSGGTYLGGSGATDVNGQKTFALTEGTQYKFRADRSGYQFWSAVVTAPAEVTVAIPSPTTVTVTQGGVPQSGVVTYAFTSAGSYPGFSATTAANGQATFLLAEGGQFKLRADKGGRQFWSEVFTAPAATSVTIPMPTTVTVLQGGVAQPGTVVYVFSGAGVYQSVSGTTDAAGQVSFLLAEGQQWKFRADRSGRQFWSETITAPGTATAVIPMPTTITVTQGGVPQNATPVYAFTAAGTYLTYSVSTAANGQASFLLPEGSDYKLRADKNGRQFWSPVFAAPATTSVDIPLATQATYVVRALNTWTGAPIGDPQHVNAASGRLDVPLPLFSEDDAIHRSQTWDGADVLLVIE